MHWYRVLDAIIGRLAHGDRRIKRAHIWAGGSGHRRPSGLVSPFHQVGTFLTLIAPQTPPNSF